MKGLIVFLPLLSVVVAQEYNFFEVVLKEWDAWKLSHGKTYNSTNEDRLRLKIFMNNKAKIAKHNIRASKGEHSYFLKMNHFGDLLHHEFTETRNGYRKILSKKYEVPEGTTFLPSENVVLPDSMDWRTKGAVTPVKDQGQCGSCWSFSATGALEGQHFRKTGKLVSLSEQNLIDCSRSYGNEGCNGGLMDFAYKYIQDNGGIDSEESYPYEAEDDTCRYKSEIKAATDSGFVDIPQGDEEALQHAMATVGPISVAIDASQDSLQFYSHGIYSDDQCSSTALDHGVLAVGYGKDEETGKEYWIVKNSWSDKWGDQGYFKMLKNADNMCGIASSASYPLV